MEYPPNEAIITPLIKTVDAFFNDDYPFYYDVLKAVRDGIPKKRGVHIIAQIVGCEHDEISLRRALKLMKAKGLVISTLIKAWDAKSGEGGASYKFNDWECTVLGNDIVGMVERRKNSKR